MTFHVNSMVGFLSLISGTLETRVRLGGSSKVNFGRAEYFNGTHWGTICDTQVAVDGWPSVFCVNLGGYSGASDTKLAKDSWVGVGKGLIVLKEIFCFLSKGYRKIEDCMVQKNKDCSHKHDRVITCKGKYKYHTRPFRTYIYVE